MIEMRRTGLISGIVISKVAHEGLSVTVDGKPAMLAIVTADGQVVAAGSEVAKEAAAVAVNSFRQMLMGEGHLRVMSEPLSAVVQPTESSRQAANDGRTGKRRVA